MKADIYTRITDQIVTALEAGVKPWHRPWNADHSAGRITRPLRSNLEPYRGINVLMLWSEAIAHGYTTPVWLTYRQASALGGQVRKGEHGALVVYASTLHREDVDARTGEASERAIPFLKGYTVFNVAQVDNLPQHFYAQAASPAGSLERIAGPEAFVTATRARIAHRGARASYCLADDTIQMPPLEAFRDAPSYYATLIHELTHWTRHPARLGRDLGRKRWGDAGYAMEELVAELGAAFLLADLGLSPQPRPEHASYIASWLAVLRDDKRAIFSAAAHAQRAADFLHGLQSPQAAT